MPEAVANSMPANQKPAKGQRAALPTERATSSIPSAAGGDPLWVYPSEQQFYNAMKRKGYSPHEEEMNAVVAIHNAVNERAWAEVRQHPTARLHTHTQQHAARFSRTSAAPFSSSRVFRW